VIADVTQTYSLHIQYIRVIRNSRQGIFDLDKRLLELLIGDQLLNFRKIDLLLLF